MSELRKTVCNRDCPDVCGIVATVEHGRVTKIGGDPDHPVTKGFLCYRTNHFLATQYAPDRIVQPLYRERISDEFRAISWTDALDLAAEKLVTIRRESGAAAILAYRSGGSLGLTKHLVDYFFERFGPTTIKRGDICSGAGDFAQLVDFGEEESHDLFDLLNAKHIILWGKNVFVSSPHTIPVLRDARARGAELVLIDPVHHRTASLCQAVHQPRPGGDLALALAVARVLFERGWTDPQAADYCDHLDAFRALAERCSVAEWCARADVAPEVAIDLARRLHDRPTAILVGWGMGRRSTGASIIRALDALGAISGNLGIAGGGVSFYFKRRGAFDTSFVKGAEVAPRTISEPLFGKEILAAHDPPIRAVWITAGNPVTMLPDSTTNAHALATRDFVVVVDSFLTDTARVAHLLLPTTTLLEADDVMGAYGHHWLGVATPVVPPPPEVKSDLQIIQELATRVGLGDALAGDAATWKRRLLRPEVAAAGVTMAELEQAPRKNPLIQPVLFADRKFKTASGRVNLMTELPTFEAAPAAIRPLVLMAISTDRSQSSQEVRHVPPDEHATVTVHPDVAAAAGIAAGGLARLDSAIGSLLVRVATDAKQRRDVALTPKGGQLSAGKCANQLVRGRLSDFGECAALYEEHVRLLPPT